MDQQLSRQIQVELPTGCYLPATHLFRDGWSGSEDQQRYSDPRRGARIRCHQRGGVSLGSERGQGRVGKGPTWPHAGKIAEVKGE